METTYTLFHDTFKTKIIKKTPQITKFGMPKTWRLNLRQNLNTHYHNTPFLTIFNFKKVTWEQIYDFKS